MNYEVFSSDLPGDSCFSFTSIEENEEALKAHGIDQPMRQVGRGQFRSDLAVKSTDQAELFSDRYNLALSMQLGPPPGHVALLIPRTASGKFLGSGINLGNEKLLFYSEESTTEIVGPALVGSDSISISRDRFAAMVERLCPGFEAKEQVAVVAGDPVRLQTLRAGVVDYVTRADSDVDCEGLSNLLAAAILWLGDFADNSGGEARYSYQDRSRIAKRAREFIEANYREPVHMEEICLVTGVGVRTLQRSFRTYFDLTVSQYLKAVRLDAVNRALSAAHPSCTTVAEIGLQHGFNHLGRLSVDFRQRFGKTPSQALNEMRH